MSSGSNTQNNKPDIRSIPTKIPILVVDDSPVMRRIVRSGLQSLGFTTVAEAEDGLQALRKLEGGEFKLVISDWNMPKMLGIELLKAVRSTEKLKTLPFLMLTAEGKKENVVEAIQAGVSNFIIKPFNVESLEEKLSSIAHLFVQSGQK